MGQTTSMPAAVSVHMSVCYH